MAYLEYIRDGGGRKDNACSLDRPSYAAKIVAFSIAEAWLLESARSRLAIPSADAESNTYGVACAFVAGAQCRSQHSDNAARSIPKVRML